MIRATDFAHLLLRQTVQAGDWAIDATVGNGHDTLFLSQLVGSDGHVFGFDVQQQALDQAKARLAEHPQVTLIHAGHETMSRHLPEDALSKIKAIMFNLGYLPGADKTIITKSETTLEAIRQSLDLLAPGGLITLVLYLGHEGGAEEAETVLSFAASLPPTFKAGKYERLRTENPAPMLLVIERTK